LTVPLADEMPVVLHVPLATVVPLSRLRERVGVRADWERVAVRRDVTIFPSQLADDGTPRHASMHT
jgi:hypothetical protein